MQPTGAFFCSRPVAHKYGIMQLFLNLTESTSQTGPKRGLTDAPHLADVLAKQPRIAYGLASSQGHGARSASVGPASDLLFSGQSGQSSDVRPHIPRDIPISR